MRTYYAARPGLPLPQPPVPGSVIGQPPGLRVDSLRQASCADLRREELSLLAG